jgi:hypothetical protein
MAEDSQLLCGHFSPIRLEKERDVEIQEAPTLITMGSTVTAVATWKMNDVKSSCIQAVACLKQRDICAS